jgi:hypothetical protein
MTQPSSTEQPSKDSHSAVRSIVSSLLLAIKMFSLYPEDHVHCQKAVDRLHNELEAFLQNGEPFILEVSDNQLLYLGDAVHQGPVKEGELVFALFRDGIVSLAVTQGLEREETLILVRILERYKSLPSAAEGDIVTAFWEAELPHLEYQAMDNIMEFDGSSDSSDSGQDWLGSMSPGTGEVPTSSVLQASIEPPRPTYESRLLMEPVLQLTVDEAKELEEMVRVEEERDASQEILDMLEDILREQREEDFFSYALDYMIEELGEAFVRKDFDVSLRILKSLNHIHKLCREAGPWAFTRVRKFLLRISEHDFVESLKEGWATVPGAQMAKAKEVLLFLPPESILQFGSMLRQVPVSVRTILSDVIVLLAARHIRPFEELLETADENLLAVLVPLMARMQCERSEQLIFRMTLNPSENIRRQALKAVIVRRLWAPKILAPLLSDQSGHIRQLVVTYLSSRRDEAAEAVLIEHLKKAKFSKNEGDELITCFKALGKCGSYLSIPFLQNTLLKAGIISRFRGSARRRGAAIALQRLNSEQSRGVLEEACRSRFPAVRNAAQTVYRPHGA